MLAALLARGGVAVSCRERAAETIDGLRTPRRLDLIISDLMVPAMDGMEFAGQEFWNEAAFRRILADVPAAACVCDAQGLVTYFNSRAEQIWGRKLLLNDPRDRYCGSSRMFTRAGTPLLHEQGWMARALADEREYSGFEVMIEQPDGKRVAALAHAKPVHDPEGRLLGALNVLVDITDRRRSEQTKDEFLALLGHELRNPLGPVRNAVHILKGKGPADEESTWALELIERQLDELVSVIESVSEVSRLARGLIQLSTNRFDIGNLVSTAVAQSAPVLLRKGQRSVVTLPPPGSSADGDEKRIGHAVRTMLQRGSKSLRSGAEIVVDAQVRGDAWAVAVGSAGCTTVVAADGPEHTLNASTVPLSEVSVGLTLVRGLAQMHGGTLTVEAPEPDAIRYLLWLPRKAPR